MWVGLVTESLLGAMNDPEVKELLDDPDVQAKLMQAMNSTTLFFLILS
jgi:hypothetical protein